MRDIKLLEIAQKNYLNCFHKFFQKFSRIYKNEKSGLQSSSKLFKNSLELF